MNILTMFWLNIVRRTGDLIMMNILRMFWLNIVRRTGENRMPFCLLCLHLISQGLVDFNKEKSPANHFQFSGTLLISTRRTSQSIWPLLHKHFLLFLPSSSRLQNRWRFWRFSQRENFPEGRLSTCGYFPQKETKKSTDSNWGQSWGQNMLEITFHRRRQWVIKNDKKTNYFGDSTWPKWQFFQQKLIKC